MESKEYIIGNEMNNNPQYQAACEYLATKNFWNFNNDLTYWDEKIDRNKDCYYLENYTQIIQDKEHVFYTPSRCAKFVLKNAILDLDKQIVYHGASPNNVSSILKNDNLDYKDTSTGGNAKVNSDTSILSNSLTPIYAQFHAEPEEWEDKNKKKWYVQVILMIQQNAEYIEKWLKWTCSSDSNIEELHRLYGGYLNHEQIQYLKENLTGDAVAYANAKIFAILVKMHEEHPSIGEYKEIERAIKDPKRYELQALARVIVKNISQHFKLDIDPGMPEESCSSSLSPASKEYLAKNYISKPGVNKSLRLHTLLGSKEGEEIIADANRDESLRYAVMDAGKSFAVGRAINRLAGALDPTIVPAIGWGIPAVLLTKDLKSIASSSSLMGDEAWSAAVKTIASTLATIGSGLAGVWAGIETGTALGTVTGPGAILTGLVGGLIGGVAGGYISKRINPPLKLTSSSFKNGDKLPAIFREPLKSPDLKWENVPGKTESFALLMQQGDKIRWLILNINPKERSWSAGRRDIDLERFSYSGINKNESKDIKFMVIALSSKITQSQELTEKAVGCGILKAIAD